MLTIKEAAACFQGLTEFRIRELIKNGTLPYMKAGAKFLVCEQAIEEFILKNYVGSGIIQDTEGYAVPLTTIERGKR